MVAITPMALFWVFGVPLWYWPMLNGRDHLMMLSVIAAFIGCACLWVWTKYHGRAGPVGPLCLVCAYRMDGLKPDPDGCTVCPECGAAWHYKPPDPADDPVD